MDEKQEKRWLEPAVKIVLSMAALFPVYAFLYVTFPASIVAFYLISAILLAAFAPWDKLKEKFLS